MNLYNLVLPDFNTADFANILPSLERSHVSVADLLTLAPEHVAKHAQIPPREVRRLVAALLHDLQAQYKTPSSSLVSSAADLRRQWQTISTLDEFLDATLGGGFPTGYLTEITGESGVGKTQLLLTLLLAVQLPPPSGLSRSALCISTEAPLSTARLSQMIKTHPRLSELESSHAPSLSSILSIQTPDLESQDHILRYQVPVAIKRHNVGLLIIDSITANYRAEFERREPGQNGERAGASMARRTLQLMELGAWLRELARTENIAVVVANQVADRFGPDERNVRHQQEHQPFASSSHPPPSRAYESGSIHTRPPPSTAQPLPMPIPPQPHSMHDPMTLNHQQRFFTGWGDESPQYSSNSGNVPRNLKTPSLGLVWTNQIAARIALIKSPSHHVTGNCTKWQRSLKLVFAPWAPPSVGRGIHIEITAAGIFAAKHDLEQSGGDA